MGKPDTTREDLKKARKDLADHKGGEDAEYERLNAAVSAAEARLPWHKR